MKQRLLLAAMMLSMSLSLFAQTSGTCGENLTWTLENGTLTISGTGEMADYKISNYAPWYYYSESITSLSIVGGVTSIGNYAFYGCSSLTSVTIPNSVTSIGNFAFCECSSLTSVTIPNSVTSIGNSAFSVCSSLTSVTIGNSVTSIGSSAFFSCSSLTSVTIGNSVTSIGSGAFFSCSSLTSVTIPNSVTSIGGSAFYECSNLTSVTIPNSVTSIGNSAFSGCRSLTSVTIPNSVTSIGNGPFSNCRSLTSIIVDDSNTTYCDIDGVLFSKDKTTLVQYPAGKTAASYTIPNRVTSIGQYAFASCSSLTSVTIPNSVTSIGTNALRECSSLTSVTIPNSVTSIGDYAFSVCSSLTSVTVGNSVTSIEQSAFSGCSSLKNVVLGSSVKVLEKEAFSGCKAIETFTCYSMRPPTVKTEKGEAFYGLSYNTIIYVPADSYETYYNHDVWGLYDVRPIGGKSVETEEVKVTPSDHSADIAWPVVTGAVTYELVIRDKAGNIICTLSFNNKGQLTSIAFSAPSRGNAPDNVQTAGFSFNVTGLEQGTTYNYTLTAKDSGGNAIDTKTGEFTTEGATALDEVQDDQPAPRKVMRDGVMYILMPDGRMYDLQGAEVL